GVVLVLDDLQHHLVEAVQDVALGFAQGLLIGDLLIRIWFLGSAKEGDLLLDRVLFPPNWLPGTGNQDLSEVVSEATPVGKWTRRIPRAS
ncbi:MAG: hypothetical protein RLY23_205, partial [Actinomycetota bacterium]